MPPTPPLDEDALERECKRYGLPVSLDVLLRHIYNNRDAVIGNYQAVIEAYKAKLREIHHHATAIDQEFQEPWPPETIREIGTARSRAIIEVVEGASVSRAAASTGEDT